MSADAAVWAFDVDACLVDSITGTSLRPLARPVLESLRAQGATVVLWSAGGGEYAQRRAVAVGIDDLVHACYDKDGRGADGRWALGDGEPKEGQWVRPQSSSGGR